jgi:hypothetical protein
MFINACSASRCRREAVREAVYRFEAQIASPTSWLLQDQSRISEPRLNEFLDQTRKPLDT